jgi:Mlc titration factor MtfA (ptsG expression regulator)
MHVDFSQFKTQKELSQAWDQILSDYKLYRQKFDNQTARQLRLNGQAFFHDKNGFKQQGNVIKINRKTATVLVGKTKWRVSLSLLTPVV